MQGNLFYIDYPTEMARLRVPSDTNILFFTKASGTEQRSPAVGCASVPVRCLADGLQVEHDTGATIRAASSPRELRRLADTVSATPRPAITPARLALEKLPFFIPHWRWSAPLHLHPNRMHQRHLQRLGGRDLQPLEDLPALPGA